ncbi:MAG: hypothetical protein FWB87_15050 [Defluviitaleaceae bacterium]|nr:hypothetical protein [Defluviitaleaceae bacterium]
MAALKPVSANMRISNEKERICSVLNVAHDVAPQVAANFVDAIEKIYNNGACTARLSITLDVER